MTNFRTEFEINEFPKKIDYSHNILSFGSCFSENIGEKLIQNKFNVTINPFGILYNPESIALSLDILFKEKMFNEQDLFSNNGIWGSFYHHSRFSDVNLQKCLNKINLSIKDASEKLKSANFIFFTFGTSWVYELKQTQKIVSNCHKISADKFRRFRLSYCDIAERFTAILKKIEQENPNCEIIFTVSPIRHLKDGAVENQISKATLLTAINELVSDNNNANYFPSYEIMMDDLRDYRFYADDMLHPSEQAINYIWDKFKYAAINSNVFSTMFKIKKIQQAINHKPFQPNTESHKAFLIKCLDDINSLVKKSSEINFEKEIEKINSHLSTITI